ncbi:MAG: hypothetical protein M3R36_17500 [Bacteroidota bacterium]|nr:hypothetical protein [Bacteroidota bacterium]
MKKIYSFFVFIFLCIFAFNYASAQVAVTNPGNTTPALAATYTSLANAITALNGTTAISGPVIITLTGNETAPAGGYSITAIPTGASAINNITIAGSGSTITAFTPQTVGALNDAIFKLIGADFITIQNFTMQENAANTINTPATSNNMTEWGVALLYASLTNGSQNNTIQNNTISLNRAYLNTFGIYSNTRHSATAIATSAEVTSASGSNSNTKVYTNAISNVNYGIVFIGAGTTIAAIDNGNDIGGSSAATGNTITNWGGGAALSGYISLTGSNYCIFDNQQINDNVSFNTITSAALTQSVTTGGFLKNYSIGQPTGTITTTINNNTVTVTNNPTSATTGSIIGINNQGLTPLLSTATMSMNNNTVKNCVLGGSISTTNGLTAITNLSLPGTMNMTGDTIINNSITATTATSGTLLGMSSSGAAGTVNMNNNVIRNMSSSATTGQMQGIANTGAVVTALNMNNNQLGNTSGGYFSSSVASSGTLFGIVTSGGASTCALSIQNNDIRGITYNVAATSSNSYFQNSAATLSQNISSNTFTNLNVNTTGSITFISCSVSLSAAGIQNVNSNSIVTAFNKGGAGGTITFFTSNASSVAGSIVNNNNNNFSNITVTGATTIVGWSNTDGGSPFKAIKNNIFRNISGGSSAITIMTINFGSDSVIGNTIRKVTGTGAITGISRGSSGTTSNLFSNTIDSLYSTGASSVIAISYAAPSGGTISKNKIYDLQANNASGLVNGILVSGGTTVTVQNNLIGDLKTPTASASNPLIGISITGGTTVNSFYNTIWLNATSSGANFGSSAISASTTPTVTFRNNIFVNTSTPNGTGLTVAHRRSSTTLTTYGATSNNNLYYTSATPDATHLIFNDGTNSDQTLADYKTRVSPRDAQSVTENPNFLSTTGSSANFLHINTAIATQIESGGANVSGITDDYDADIRQGNPGYTGTGTAPDIGADEFNGIPADLNGPIISNTSLADTCGYGNRNLNGVTITDGSGVAGGANAPRVYWKVNSGSWASAATGSITSPYNFIIGTTGLVNGDTVYFFVIAQDNVGNVSANPGAGLAATDVNTISTFPTNPNRYRIVCTDNVGVSATSLNAAGVYSAGKGYNFTATVKNFGTVTQNSVPVYFTDNGGAPNGPVNTVGPIITNGTENVTFSGGFAFTPLTGGTHIVKIYTALAADTAKGNDTLTITLNVNALAKISTYPYIQTFTNPVGWTVLLENVVGTTPLWGLGICTNPDGKVGDTAATSNCFNGSSGRKEVFRSPEMDFTSLTNPVLNFYVAYKTFNAENDSMEVLVSTNQGISFFSATTVFNKGNASVPSLATRPASTTQFFPDSSIQWRHETINLSNIAGAANIVIGFRSKSQFGNRQWVDNVIVTNDDALCNNTVTTPGIYNCNPNLSLNFGTVGLRPAENPGPTVSNLLKANSETIDSRILGKLNSTNWSGQIISSTELDNPTGGVATILQFNNSASTSGSGIATNAGATTQDGTVLTPNKIIANSYFTATYTGNDKNGYATYSISINAAAFPGVPNYNKAYIVKRSDVLGKWIALNTTTSTTTLTAAGLKTFSDFAVAVDSTSTPVAINDAGVYAASSIPSGIIYTGMNLCFDARVKNYGSNNQSAIPVQYTINGGSPVGPVNTGALNSGDTTTVSFCGAQSFTPASAGSYTLKFFTSLAGDTSYANDTTTLLLTVIDSTRDAGVTSAVSIPSGTIYTGVNLCFDATVKNFGQAFLASVPTYYTVNGGSAVGPVNASNLASGDSTIVNFCGAESYTPASAGSYTLKFYTLLSGDANGANDTATLVLTVIDSTRDAGVTSAVSIPSGTLYTGVNLCFDATVKNFGQAFLASVPTYYTVNGGSAVGPVNASNLASGDSTVVNFCGAESYTPALAGSYTLKFYTLLSGDANGANDTATLLLTVIDSTKDAGVTSAVSIPSGTLYTGVNLCFDATVKNFGQAFLASVPTYYTVNGGSPVGPVSASNIPSGDSTVVNFCGAESYTPASAGSYTLKFYTLLSGDANGSNDTATLILTVIDSLITGKLNLTVNLEAYSPLPDTITVTLRSTTTPYPVVSTAKGEIDVNGDISLNFSNVSNGPSYYIVVNHRQSIETWSATGQVFTSGVMTYDFTTAITQAFGNNMILVNGEASIYTGDVNQDYAVVDLSDLAIMDNAVLNFVSGPYVITDLNGDDFVDINDMAYVDNNAFNFVMREIPNLRPGQDLPSMGKKTIQHQKMEKK